MGWKAVLGNLTDVAPGKMIGGDVYQNRNGHLPQAPGRIWYEADVNFTDGYRTRHRILYSSDGLIFLPMIITKPLLRLFKEEIT